jgi:hypothetical protein
MDASGSTSKIRSFSATSPPFTFDQENSPFAGQFQLNYVISRNAPLKRGENPVIGQEYLRKSYQADDLK